MTPESPAALLRRLAVGHRQDARMARALGQEASARLSDEAAEMLEREVRLMGGDMIERSDDTPITTRRVTR